jgi:hypothetical protein
MWRGCLTESGIIRRIVLLAGKFGAAVVRHLLCTTFPEDFPQVTAENPFGAFSNRAYCGIFPHYSGENT